MCRLCELLVYCKVLVWFRSARCFFSVKCSRQTSINHYYGGFGSAAFGTGNGSPLIMEQASDDDDDDAASNIAAIIITLDDKLSMVQ